MRTSIADGNIKTDITFRHFNRVLRYARSSDYAVAAGVSALSPTMMWVMERVAPSYVGKGGFAPVMRLSFLVSISGGFLMLYKRSQSKFYSSIF